MHEVLWTSQLTEWTLIRAAFLPIMAVCFHVDLFTSKMLSYRNQQKYCKKRKWGSNKSLKSFSHLLPLLFRKLQVIGAGLLASLVEKRNWSNTSKKAIYLFQVFCLSITGVSTSCVNRKPWSRRSKVWRNGCQRSSRCWAILRSSFMPSLVTTLTWRQMRAKQTNGIVLFPKWGLCFPSSSCFRSMMMPTKPEHGCWSFVGWGLCLHWWINLCFDVGKQINKEDNCKGFVIK